MAANTHPAGRIARRGDPQGTTRRAILFVGVAAVAAVAAGSGALAAMLRPLHQATSSQPPPPDLLAALAAENALIESVDAVLRHNPSLAGPLGLVRANHLEHQAALQAATSAYRIALARSAPTPPPGPGSTVSSVTQLALMERRASASAAARAARLSGPVATLLASIAACEATHGELLS